MVVMAVATPTRRATRARPGLGGTAGNEVLPVVTTVLVLASGVALLLIGHHSDTVLLVHKASFIVWSAVFAVHFLAYLPRALRAVVPREAVPGAASRAAVVLVSVAAGAALAL